MPEAHNIAWIAPDAEPCVSGTLRCRNLGVADSVEIAQRLEAGGLSVSHIVLSGEAGKAESVVLKSLEEYHSSVYDYFFDHSSGGYSECWNRTAVYLDDEDGFTVRVLSDAKSQRFVCSVYWERAVIAGRNVRARELLNAVVELVCREYDICGAFEKEITI